MNRPKPNDPLKLCIAVYLSLFAAVISGSDGRCPCESQELCTQNHFENHREVTVISEKKSDFTRWTWDGINNVISSGEDNPELMCYTHSKQANYGVLECCSHLWCLCCSSGVPVTWEYVRSLKNNGLECSHCDLLKMPTDTTINKVDFDKWVDDSLKKANRNFAEIIAVDLLDFLDDCHEDEHTEQRVINLTQGFVDRLKFYNFKLHCIMPWKPPCFQSNCNVTATLKEICDGIITSPDSFITDCDLHCRARATMPFSNMIIGTDEYLFKQQVPASKFYAGIPWHGYDYKCHSLGTNIPKGEKNPDVCYVPKVNGSEVCDFKSSRTKMTFYDLDTQYPEQYGKEHQWSFLYNANYFNVNKTADGEHQIWYESDESLYQKYRFALDMGFRGVVIWTVDDLMNYNKGDAQEWNWLMHTMMLTGDHPNKPDMSMALKAMLIGVGCFIGGTFVGAVITTLIARRQMKLLNRGYKRPFQKDGDEEDETANFHEDDKYL